MFQMRSKTKYAKFFVSDPRECKLAWTIY